MRKSNRLKQFPYSLIETTRENGLDPYRYLLWGLQSAPKLSEMDTTWEEHLTPSTHWINAGCQKIKESWLVQLSYTVRCQVLRLLSKCIDGS